MKLFKEPLKVDFEAVFDAGVLVIYADSTQWAKFCFEYSSDHQNMVVTVCNNQFSDHHHHIVTASDEMYLRIAGLVGGAYAFHYSTDGEFWHMARYFYLDPNYDYRVGFLSQSPRGEEFTTVFSDIEKLFKIRNLRYFCPLPALFTPASLTIGAAMSPSAGGKITRQRTKITSITKFKQLLNIPPKNWATFGAENKPPPNYPSKK